MLQRHAFTLVELAIVLVIVGLLVGGVMAGQVLIHASELRAITVESEKYKTAVNSFLDQYIALPGDMPNAQRFWGVLHATPATCDITPATGVATCNGDGDKQVGLSGSASYETLRFWQHLSNAKLVEGQFTGTGSTQPGTQTLAATNIPPSKFPNGAWCARYRSGGASGGTLFDEATANHMLVFGDDTSADPCEAPILNPGDALNIDIKMDDGKPGTGGLQALWRSQCADAASGTDYAAAYRATSLTTSCALFFRKAF